MWLVALVSIVNAMRVWVFVRLRLHGVHPYQSMAHNQLERSRTLIAN